MHSQAFFWAPFAVGALLLSAASAFPEAAVKPRARFNYSSRPSAAVQQSNPIRDRVPDFSLIDENDEESTTRSPIEASFGYQFSEVSSGLNKRTEGEPNKPVVAPEPKPESKNPDAEEDESNEDTDSRRLRLRSRQEPVRAPVEDDEPQTSTVRVPIPPAPIAVHFYEVSSKLNEKKPTEAEEKEKEAAAAAAAEEQKKKTEAEKKQEEDSDEEDDASDEKKEDVDTDSVPEESRRGARQFASQFSNLRQNVGCGYYRMRNGNVISFQSNNFNFSEYSNNALCSWRFFGQQCILRVSCPCFDVPASKDCFQDELKITDGYSFFQKFCGYIRPQGSYKSTTNNLNVWFKTDWQDTATGVFCYVTCTGPGQQEPATPPVTCPTPIFPGPTAATSTINPSNVPPGVTGQVGVAGAPPFSTPATGK